MSASELAALNEELDDLRAESAAAAAKCKRLIAEIARLTAERDEWQRRAIERGWEDRR